MITVFNAQPYDKRFLEETNTRLFAHHRFELTYNVFPLSQDTAPLAQGSDAICAFVNGHLDAHVLEALHKGGTRAALLRYAGFNNVNLKTADRLGLFVARVAAYSPEAVAEFTTALIQTLNRHTHHTYNRVA